MRLSIGLEHVDDLLADILTALDVVMDVTPDVAKVVVPNSAAAEPQDAVA